MIHFVGAGSGAEDLITVRGARLLGKADVVIYAGSLVNPALLSAYVPSDAVCHDSARMTLEEVLAVMEASFTAGKEVVRLHSGEPSLYGAVREQMDALEKRGIPYDVTPGISACFAAAASLHLEYTLPEVSQTLIITRMEGRTKVPERESIPALSAHGASMAVYLSTGMLGELSQRLTEGGYSADTPAAIVYKASWPEERCVLCTVGSLAEEAGREGIRNLAVVLVGKAVAHTAYARSRLYDPAFTTGFRP